MDDVHKILGKFCLCDALSPLTVVPVLIQQLASDINKSKRAYYFCAISGRECYNYVVGDQLQETFRRWLSPPDPSDNHNIARKAHYKGSAEWFVHGNIFSEWKRTTSSLLWIHGKRGYSALFIPAFLMETRFHSGVRKERAFVRSIPFLNLRTIDIVD